MDPTIFAGLQSPIIVASFPRSGTHLTIDVLRNQFRECHAWKWPGERSDHLYVPLEGLISKKDPHRESDILRRARRRESMVIKTHSFPEFASWRESFAHWVAWIEQKGRFLYVFRDGREALVSLYFGRHGMVPNSTDATFSQFLRLPYMGKLMPRTWADHVESWFAKPGVVTMNYRQLVRSPRAELDRLAQALSLTPDYREPLLPPPIRSLWHGRWIRLTRMRPLSTALVPGRVLTLASPKWWEVFTAEDRHWFHEHAGQTLIRTGIERDDSWVHASGPPVKSSSKP